MSTSRQQSVSDLLRNALPMGTRVVAGQKGLQHSVTWISVLQTRPPAFASLEGRELALLSIDALHLLNDKLTLVDLINDLAQMEVAAIGVVGAIDSRAIHAAEEHLIPLLNLPTGTSLRHVERDVVKVLVGPSPSAEQRGMEVHAQLLQLSTENKGMAALVNAIVDATGRTVIVQNKRLETVVAIGPITESDEWPAIEATLGSDEPLPAVFRNRVEVAQVAPDPALLDLPDFGMRRLVVPIVAGRMGRGFFSMLALGNNFDALDMQFVRHGAAVMALEMAKEKAVRDAEKKVQGGLLERLLMGSIQTDQALRQLARLGHEPEVHPYVAIAATWANENRSEERRLETIFNEQVSVHGCDALVQLLEGGVVVFCADDSGGAMSIPRAVKQLADSVLARVKSQYPDANVALGIA